MASQSQKRIFLFDMPRHRSHLAFRWLGTYPNSTSIWHPFLPAVLFGPERITLHTKKRDTNGPAEWIPPTGENTYTSVIANFVKNVDDASEAQLLIVNEHSHMVIKQDICLALIRDQDVPENKIPIHIPETMLSTFIPVFIIRHPVFAVASIYQAFVVDQGTALRPGDEDWELFSLKSQRYIFDWYLIRDGKPAAVFDGDDVVFDTDNLKSKLSKALCLKPTGFKDTWEQKPEADRHYHPIVRFLLKDIDDSTGIIRADQRPEPDLDTAYQGWTHKYGEEVAEQLKLTVEKQMEHYLYLKQFQL